MPISSKKQSIKLRSDPEGSFVAIGFAGGLNTLVSPQHLKDNECSILLNGVITEDGVITRRPGTLYYDSVADGNRVLGLFPFTVTSTTGVTTRYLLKMDDAGNLKKLDLTTKTWSTITGKTYTAGYNTELTQSYSTAYIGNGQDNLTKTDGSTITQFSSVADPSISTLTVTATGTTGSSNYSYGYTLQTSTGETLLANTNGGLPQTISITNGNATLSASNYNLITITRSSDANVTGYNVYGRTATNIFYMVTLPQTASGNITWKDDGTVTPDTFQGPPDQNSTSGVIGSIMQTYHETMFVGGIKGDPSRVYYSAGLDKFDDFQIVNGGGSISVNSSDGDEVTAIVPFKDKIVFFKNRSSYMFQFNTGSLPTVTVINPHIGCNAPRTAKVVLNDLFFLGAAGTGVFTLGYQQGYYGNGIADMLRTNEVSIKIHPTIASMNSSRIQYAAAIYSPQNYKYILAYADGGSTYNNMMAVYDTRYGAWVQWDGLNANCFCNFIDSDGKEHILYGDDNQGRVNELFVGNNDNDGSFTFRVKTKDFNNNSFHLLKTFVWPTFHFRYIKGLLKVTVITDGVNNVKTANITSTTGSYTGWSYDRWANFLWGTTTGNSASATSADAPRQLTDRYDARSIMFLFENTSATDTITLLGVECKYITRAGRRLPSQFLIQ